MWMVCCLILWAGCGGRAEVSVEQKFLGAVTAFDRAGTPEDFLRVAGMYQEILDAGFVSGAVYFNQGNAFMRADQRGRAIAAYRQAKRYRPRDPYLDANLRYALGSAPGTAARPFVEYVLFWQDWISYPAKFYAAGWSVAATFLLALAALWLPAPLWRRVVVIAALVSVLLIGSAGYDAYRFDFLEHGVVVRDSVTAYKGNAESYEPAFTEPLNQGTEFRALQQRGNWWLIRLAGSNEGWVPADAVMVY